MGIVVITTGGTIGALPYNDPHHPPKYASMPTDGTDVVVEAMTLRFAHAQARCLSLEPRDSNRIDATYRANICAAIEAAPEGTVLITHGTDTLLETADYIHRRCTMDSPMRSKVVVITGSMIPLSNGSESDGYLNLQYSLDQLAHHTTGLANVNIVLCDWWPRRYAYRPDRYSKHHYDEDGRYFRLKDRQGDAGEIPGA